MMKFPVIKKFKKPVVELDCFTALASGCVLGALCGGALVPSWMILLFLVIVICEESRLVFWMKLLDRVLPEYLH